MPPSRPSDGSFFIYLLENTHLDDGKADGYMWINKGQDSKLKKMNIKKTRFYLRKMKTQYELVERITKESCVVVSSVWLFNMWEMKHFTFRGHMVTRDRDLNPIYQEHPQSSRDKDLVLHKAASVVYKKQTTNVNIHDEHGCLNT